MRLTRGWNPSRLMLAGVIVILLGAPFDGWVRAQDADPTPLPEAIAGDDADLIGDASPEPTDTAVPTETPVESPTPTPSISAEPTTPLDPTITLEPTPTPAATASATATPEPTATLAPPDASPGATPMAATPTPAFNAAAVPACTISATSAVVGQPLTVRCDGFVPDSSVRIYWQGISRSQTSFVASPEGAGEATFPVPDVAPGRWYFRASDGQGRAATVRLTLLAPAMVTNPILGRRGAAMAVVLTGFRSGERVALRWFGVSGSNYITLRTPTVSAAGSASANLTVPNSSAVGRHRFAAVGLTSGTVVERIITVVSPGQPLNFFQGSAGCKRIAFIFNVGIGNPADPGVLATLKRENVLATMFVMGYWIERYPDSFRQIANGGFVIGSHGYDALNLPTTGDAAVRADVRAADAAIGAALGRTPDRWFTPFAASIDDRVRRLVVEEGYMPVGWRITANDWSASATEADVYARVVNGAYDGAIVEFHIDGPATAVSTGRALPRIIQTLRARGYTFVTIPQLAAPCGSPAATTEREPVALGGRAPVPGEAVFRPPVSAVARRRPGTFAHTAPTSFL